MRVVVFPENDLFGTAGLGEIYVRPTADATSADWVPSGYMRECVSLADGKPATWVPSGYAWGKVSVPDGCDLRLVLAARYPALKNIASSAHADDEEKARSIENYKRAFHDAFDRLSPDDLQSLIAFGPIDDGLAVRIGKLSGLRELRFIVAGGQVSDRTIGLLEGLGNLVSLELRSTDITDEALTSVAKMRMLRYLDISYTKVAGEKLDALSALGIEELDMCGVKLSKLGCERLASLRSLRRLKWYEGASDAGLAALSNSSKLDSISLAGAGITDDGVRHLCELSELTSVCLARTMVTDTGVRHLCKLRGLTSVDLSATTVTDVGVSEMKCLPRLSNLSLSLTAVTNATVASLSDIGSLRSLEIDAANVNDEAATYFSRMAWLERLSVRPSTVYESDAPLEPSRYPGDRYFTDEGYSCLRSMVSLRTLDLRLTPITDRTLEYLQGHPSLRELLANYTAITGSGLGFMPELTTLFLGGTRLTNDALRAVSTCNNLQQLYIWGTGVLDSGVAMLTRLQKLRSLSLSFTGVTDDGIKSLVSLANLEELWLAGLDLTDASLTAIAAMPSLRKLDISPKQLTGAGLGILAGCRNLHSITLRDRSTSEEMVSELREAMPWCRVAAR